MTLNIIGLITAFGIAFFVIPEIIKITATRHLFDQPNARSSHQNVTPTLGGIGIFLGLVFSVFFWIPEISSVLKYAICALLIILSVGVRDDVLPLSAKNKFLAQLIAVGILIYFSGIRITGFHGLFGLEEIEIFWSYGISALIMLTVINGFNLIDGIDGLAAGIGILCSLILGVFSHLMGLTLESLIAFSLLGGLLAFLYYNWAPAKIFLGDTGSMLIGLVVAVLLIQFINVQELKPGHPHALDNVWLLVAGILIWPVFDTARVFFIRIKNGLSPFKADRRHIHHLLVDAGLGHDKATILLLSINLVCILMAFWLQEIQAELSLLILFGTAMVFSMLISYFSIRSQNYKELKELLNAEPSTEPAYIGLSSRSVSRALSRGKSREQSREQSSESASSKVNP